MDTSVIALTETGRNSADKDLYKDTPSNGRVIWQDTPEYETKKPSRRRRARALASGAMYFGKKDRIFLEWVSAFPFLRIEDLQMLTVGNLGSRDAIRLRGARMVKHGLLSKTYGPNGGLIYMSTTKGLRVAGLDEYGLTKGIKPRPTTLQHAIGEAAGIAWLTNQFKGAPVITETEIWAAIKSGRLSPRVTRRWAWTEEYTDFENWRPQINGGKSAKTPDLLMLRKDRTKTLAAPIPVEIELSPKSTKEYADTWLRPYTRAAEEGHLANGIIVLVDSEDPRAKSTVENALKRAHEANRDPIAGRSPWEGNLAVRVEEMGDFYQSFETANRARGHLVV